MGRGRFRDFQQYRRRLEDGSTEVSFSMTVDSTDKGFGEVDYAFKSAEGGIVQDMAKVFGWDEETVEGSVSTNKDECISGSTSCTMDEVEAGTCESNSVSPCTSTTTVYVLGANADEVVFTDTSSDSGDGDDSAGIIGGVIGGVAVVGLVVAAVMKSKSGDSKGKSPTGLQMTSDGTVS